MAAFLLIELRKVGEKMSENGLEFNIDAEVKDASSNLDDLYDALNKVGKIATQNNIKTKENGKWFFDKSRSSHKEVETFKYNQNGVDAITALIEGELKK